ncbi:MAG: hypothetical protein AAFR59_01585 [Bacteroidota bacterium]
MKHIVSFFSILLLTTCLPAQVDGWWKYGQTSNLDVHDEVASWASGGYPRDFKQGENNMNEEWFGICAKGSISETGLYKPSPRTAYYALQEAHDFNPYEEGQNLNILNDHFSKISLKKRE